MSQEMSKLTEKSKFEELKLSAELLKAIKELGITIPTEIQELALPCIMSGEDVTGESATGSGKTLAFGCGIIDKVTPRAGLQAVVMVPTRELADQVKDSLKNFSKYKHLNIISIYGGVSISPQIHELSRADVVVATPGRLLDHLERRTINVSKIKIVVLDEADRMFEMGFIEDVEEIVRACPTERQTILFSATLSSDVKTLAKKYMKNPREFSAVKHVDPSKLKQVYYDVPKNMKLSLLVHLLKQESTGLVMVFCNTRRNADFVHKNLTTNGIDAVAIHGGLSQNKRTRTMDIFSDAKAEVLVCTDVAARGLHVDNVSHIYNYDLPRDAKDYVHRIGRTARAGDSGKAINLLCEYDYDNFSHIEREYRNFSIERIELPEIEKIRTVPVDDDRNGGGRGFSRGGFGGGRGGARDFGRGGFSRDGDRRGSSSGRSSFSRDSGRSGERRSSSSDRGSSFRGRR
ncbi:DEAD/DEAH box helicase [Candidatus Woesearchaeota archaeon]|nr:DEAD/DEAH box helicase [Candidatus Woesearchaeota archaeon]